MNTLTDKQRKLLNLLLAFHYHTGRSPSRREMSRHMGVRDHAVEVMLAALARKGHVVITKAQDGKRSRDRNVTPVRTAPAPEGLVRMPDGTLQTLPEALACHLALTRILASHLRKEG